MIFLPPHCGTTTIHGAEVHVFSTPNCKLAEVRVSIPLLRDSEIDVAAAGVLENVVLQPILPSQGRYRDTLLRKGAEFSVSLMTDKLFISGICPPDRVVECLLIVFQACVYVPTETEFVNLLHVTQTRAEILGELPDTKLHTENLRRRWGNHPFSRKTITLRGLQHLNRSDYSAFVTKWIGATGGQFVICADFPDTEHLNEYAARIADKLTILPTQISLRQQPETDVPPMEPGTYRLVGYESDTVASIQLMMPASARTATDHAAFRTASTILVAYPNSRLLTQLRDKLGIVYQISSYTDDYHGAANLTVSLKTPQHLRQETITRFTEITEKFINHGPEQDEIKSAVRYLNNSTAVNWANPAGFSSVQAALLSTGTDLGYWECLANDLAQLNVDDIRQAAQRYMAEDMRIFGST